jgi:hypothetical protein
MRFIIGLGIMVLGIITGVFVGGWVMFVGGIVQVINSLASTPVFALGIAIGIVRILFASMVGWLVASVGIVIGKIIIE